MDQGRSLQEEVFPLFRPIDMDSSSSSDSSDCMLHEVSPMAIFRDFSEGSNDNYSVPSVRRANPVNDVRMEEEVGLADLAPDVRIISPFPLDPQQDGAGEQPHDLWKLEPLCERYDEQRFEQPINYSQFFSLDSCGQGVQLMDDDFSLSSYDASSLSDENLETISDDPTSFWESHLDEEPKGTDTDVKNRIASPAQVSVGTAEPELPC